MKSVLNCCCFTVYKKAQFNRKSRTNDDAMSGGIDLYSYKAREYGNKFILKSDTKLQYKLIIDQLIFHNFCIKKLSHCWC